MDKVCVFSGSSDNLNTSMRIKLDDGSVVEVWVSDEYADDATPKLVKAAYIKRFNDREEARKKLEEMAAQFGFKVVDQSQLPPPPASIPSIKRATASQTQSLNKPANDDQTNGRRVVSGRVADTRNLNVNVVTENNEASRYISNSAEYEIKSSDTPSTDLKDGEVVEIDHVAGRNGTNIAIPVVRTGKTGRTQVKIIDNGGDNALQRRFKSMAQASAQDSVSYAREGYDVNFRQCGMCLGNGTTNGQTCPKCGGLGEIQTQRF